MPWFFAGIFGAIAIVLGGMWGWRHRRFLRDWQRLQTALDDLSAGRGVGSLQFENSDRFALAAHDLERLSAEQMRLRKQVEQDAFNLRTVLESMEEGVMLVDAQHVIRLVNPSFLQLFECKTDPIGETVLRILREATFEEMVTAALQTGEAQAREVSLNGGKPPRHFSVHAAALRDANGRQGVVVMFRDISRLRQLEDVRREFVANVSHELRTPLSIFHGYLENLIDDPGMPRKNLVQIFEILKKHSARLNALLEDLLILARLESRDEKLNLEPINVEKFLTDTADDWRLKSSQKNIAIAVDVAPGMPELTADSLRMEQVLSNLVDNAIKYTEAGGQVYIKAQANDGKVEICIQDTGQGIPPADLPHIFERFYRADKARSRDQGGTGLGLSIVKHIVQSHGGSVRAESTYGKGTAITLTLPEQRNAK